MVVREWRRRFEEYGVPPLEAECISMVFAHIDDIKD